MPWYSGHCCVFLTDALVRLLKVQMERRQPMYSWMPKYRPSNYPLLLSRGWSKVLLLQATLCDLAYHVLQSSNDENGATFFLTAVLWKHARTLRFLITHN